MIIDLVSESGHAQNCLSIKTLFMYCLIASLPSFINNKYSIIIWIILVR